MKSKKIIISETPIADLFKSFSSCAHPEGLTVDEYRDIQTAFFSGAVTILSVVQNAEPVLGQENALQLFKNMLSEAEKTNIKVDLFLLRKKSSGN